MTGSERDAFESSLIGTGGKDTSKNLRDLRARFASLVIVDESNERLFSEKDVKALGRKSAAALDRVFAAGQRLNGLTNQDVDELAGNSMSDHSEDSVSD